MRTQITALIALTSLLNASFVFGAPTKLGQQGRLLDGDGAPLTGSHEMVFSFYDSQNDGNEVWSEGLDVEFEQGYYSIVLGTATPLDDLLFAGTPVWLQLSVDDVVLSPRQEVVSVPFALRAVVAESVEGGTVDADEVSIAGTPVIDSNGNWLGTPLDWSELTGIPNDLADGDADTDTLLGLACSDGQVPTYDGASALWICAAPSGMDTLALLSCVGGELVSWDDSNSQWVCSSDADTQLSESQVEDFITNSALELSAGSSMAGALLATQDDLTTSLPWSSIIGAPSDSDTLLGLPCADGFVAKYSTSLGAWDCAEDDDSFAALVCQAGEIPVYEAISAMWICGQDLDTDIQLTESQVDSFVANNGYSTGAHTVNTDTQLTESQVDSFVANNGYSLGAHTVNTDALAALNCSPGETLQTDPNTGGWACVIATLSLDSDGDGVVDSADCAPLDPQVSPLALETCDGTDNNCNGLLDEATAVDATIWYADADGDGAAGSTLFTNACNQPAGFFATGADCNDTDASVSPSQQEVCDGTDNNCNNLVDEGFDSDGDGVSTCGPGGVPGTGDDDCNDADNMVYPGATEVCDDGIDQDCDGVDPATGSSVCPALSCSSLLNLLPASPNGKYWIDNDSNGVAEELYCDMTTDNGGWTVALYQMGTNNIISDVSFANFCAARGIPSAGRGVEDVDSWLVAKRHLWSTNHPLRVSGWPNGRASLAMPMTKGNNQTPKSIFSGSTVTLPSNLTGDHCNEAGGQFFCGYYWRHGWDDVNQGATPDPEDWGDVHDDADTWISCMFR
jgi:hypothetical protein